MGMGAELMKKLLESCKKLNKKHRVLASAAIITALIVAGVWHILLHMLQQRVEFQLI